MEEREEEGAMAVPESEEFVLEKLYEYGERLSESKDKTKVVIIFFLLADGNNVAVDYVYLESTSK